MARRGKAKIVPPGSGKSLLRDPVTLGVKAGLDEVREAAQVPPGTALVYLGDTVPFAKFVPSSKDGEKALLPCFPRKQRERPSADRQWSSTPCVEGAGWRVLDVEKDRKSVVGKPLPDLFVLESDELPGVLCGLGLDNLKAKFRLAPEAALAARAAEAAAEQADKAKERSFAEGLRDAGW